VNAGKANQKSEWFKPDTGFFHPQMLVRCLVSSFVLYPYKVDAVSIRVVTVASTIAHYVTEYSRQAIVVASHFSLRRWQRLQTG